MGTTYTARVTRDEDAWSVEVPEVARTTQALHLREVEPMARDLVAVMLDVDPESVEVEVVWPDDIAGPMAEWRDLVARADELRAAAAERQREVATSLRERGESVRDIAAVMGLSFQRVQQLTGATKSAGRVNSRTVSVRTANPGTIRSTVRRGSGRVSTTVTETAEQRSARAFNASSGAKKSARRSVG